MDKYPRLEEIHKSYKPFYNDAWEIYTSIFHFTMLENQFLVANGNNISDRFSYNKNQNEQLIVYVKGDQRLTCKVHRQNDFFVVDEMTADQTLPWIRINTEDHLNKKKQLVHVPMLMKVLNGKIKTIADHISSRVYQPVLVEMNVHQTSTIQCSTTESIDVHVLNVNVDDQNDLPDEPSCDPLLNTPGLH